MTTTISIDKEIRDRAAKRAKYDQLPVSAIVRILLNDYAEGKIQIGTKFSDEPKIEIIEVDKNTQNLMDDVVKTWHENKL